VALNKYSLLSLILTHVPRINPCFVKELTVSLAPSNDTFRNVSRYILKLLWVLLLLFRQSINYV